MAKNVNRREFVLSGAAAVVAAASARAVAAQAPPPAQGPTMVVKKTVTPVVVASNNGNVYKNGGDITGVAKAFTMITGGSDVLDALIAGVNLCELDPLETRTAWSSSIPRACTGRRGGLEPWPASKASGRRRSWRRPSWR
jgi:N4-(beta-N-acetylglucosaminyl)-L-asparaginase